MIQIEYEDHPSVMSHEELFNMNCQVYGSLCRWTTHGRWRGLPIEDPLADDEDAWASGEPIQGHYIDLEDVDIEWFSMLVWVHDNS